MKNPEQSPAANGNLSPIYREQRHTYHADTCQALINAAREGKVRFKACARGSYPGTALPPGVMPGLSSVGFWDVVGKQDWGLELHRNEGIELTFLERGSLPFLVNGQGVTLQPGSLTITRPWQSHQIGNPHLGASRLCWIILDVNVRRPNQDWKWPPWIILQREDLAELTRMLRGNERPVWPATHEVRNCFQKIGQVLESGAAEGTLSRLAVAINELLLLIFEMLRQMPVELDADLISTQRTIDLFWADLRQNLENLAHPWTLEEMARQCGLGVTRFIQYCKQIHNMTPMQFLAHCRVEAAVGLLGQAPRMSITDVAFACGFSSSQYFATMFSKVMKCSPKEYRSGLKDARSGAERPLAGPR